MNIERTFNGASQDGHKFNIQGTYNEPLFQANQIGKLMGLANICKSIKEFDVDEVVVAGDSMFLTEFGIFRLLSVSNPDRLYLNPIARPFQKWLYHVVNEIRSTESTRAFDDMMIMNKKTTEDAVMTAIHKTLMTANKDTPLVYLAEVGQLPDGRILLKFGETDDVVGREKYLRTNYDYLYFVKMYVCVQPHKLEQWMKHSELFMKHKYNGFIKGQRHDEVLVVTPGEYTTVKRFMKKHMSIFDGWTAAQALEKLRLQPLPSLVELFKMWPTTAATFTDSVTRINAERAMASAMQLAIDKYGKSDDCVSHQWQQDDEDEVEVVVNDAIPDSPIVDDEPGQSEIMPDDDVPLVTSKLGKIAKIKTPIFTAEDAQLQRFFDECCVVNPYGKTHISHVLACHRLWRGENIARDDTNAMIAFFKKQFQTIQETDNELDMKCTFYKGMTMKPWQYNIKPENALNIQEDVSACIMASCDLHIMGRTKVVDIWDAFIESKKKQDPEYNETAKEKKRFFKHMKTMFVHYTNITFNGDKVTSPGFYGLYMKTASKETRLVGYNKSPNTQINVFKLDGKGNILQTIASQDVFAKTIVKKSSQYVCIEMTKSFANGMKPYSPGDGFGYMRATDHATMMAAQKM